MEKKLYRVKVILYVMAENESDDCVGATRARFDIFECVATKAEYVDPVWNDSIPYNADDERTCSVIMPGKQQADRPGGNPVKLPIYVEAGIKAFDVDNRYLQPGQ